MLLLLEPGRGFRLNINPTTPQEIPTPLRIYRKTFPGQIQLHTVSVAKRGRWVYEGDGLIEGLKSGQVLVDLQQSYRIDRREGR